MSSWGVDCVAALRAAIVRGDARPPSAKGFLPGVDDADDASDVWEFDGGMPVDDAADVVEAERLLLGGAASLPDASTSKATTWLRAVTCVLFFVLSPVFSCFVPVSVQRHRRVASLCLSPTPSTLRRTVYVHLYAIDAAGSLHTLGQKISSPRRADSEGAVGRGKRTGGKGGGDGGTAPRRAALDSDEAEMGSRAGDADGDRRVLGDAACGDRGGGRASGSATAWAMRKEMSRLSSGVFFGFGCFTGSGVLRPMAASRAAARHRQPRAALAPTSQRGRVCRVSEALV